MDHADSYGFFHQAGAQQLSHVTRRWANLRGILERICLERLWDFPFCAIAFRCVVILSATPTLIQRLVSHDPLMVGNVPPIPPSRALLEIQIYHIGKATIIVNSLASCTLLILTQKWNFRIDTRNLFSFSWKIWQDLKLFPLVASRNIVPIYRILSRNRIKFSSDWPIISPQANLSILLMGDYNNPSISKRFGRPV